MKTLGLVVLALIVIEAINIHFGPTQVALPGYSHAVVICGTGLIVNHGHYKDPQVAALILKADGICPKK